MEDISITVVCDNNPYREGLETAWGFSAVIAGAEKTILFDTDGDGPMLLGNMERLAIDPQSIDLVVLSHIHGDHTGGLDGFLEKNSGVSVYMPMSFSKKFKDGVASCGAKVVEVERPLEICENVYSTGQIGRLIKEQSLVIRTGKGLVVMVGCAHPGIVKIINTVKGFLSDDILLVMGGFHFEWATKGKIKRVISAFEELGVRYVGLCHCTGDKASDLFEEHFGENYINVGAGKVVTTADL
ncbi:MAG: MBL fold metallo-hydrolase [Sedimentisphaerales bacterium]